MPVPRLYLWYTDGDRETDRNPSPLSIAREKRTLPTCCMAVTCHSLHRLPILMTTMSSFLPLSIFFSY
jgi:hypothetical protein